MTHDSKFYATFKSPGVLKIRKKIGLGVKQIRNKLEISNI